MPFVADVLEILNNSRFNPHMRLHMYLLDLLNRACVCTDSSSDSSPGAFLLPFQFRVQHT